MILHVLEKLVASLHNILTFMAININSLSYSPNFETDLFEP